MVDESPGKGNIWDRIEDMQNQILEIETALSHILTPQDEPDNENDGNGWSEQALSDVCEACSDRADFISAYAIHNAGWVYGMCQKHDRDPVPEIVAQAAAVWEAMQNERNGTA